MSWCPIFPEITRSSVWRAPAHIFKAWLSILTHKDHITHVWRGNAYTLADEAKITKDEAKQAIAVLSSPDEESLTQDHDGKRILSDDGEHWFVVNGQKYADMIQKEIERENARRRTEKWRAGKKAESSTGNSDDTAKTPMNPAAASTFAPKPDPLEIPENLKTPLFCNKWQVWMNQRRGHHKVKDWVAYFREQLDWLSEMGPDRAVATLTQGILGNHQGLFPVNGNGSKPRELRGGKMIEPGKSF